MNHISDKNKTVDTKKSGGFFSSLLSLGFKAKMMSQQEIFRLNEKNDNFTLKQRPHHPHERRHATHQMLAYLKRTITRNINENGLWNNANACFYVYHFSSQLLNNCDWPISPNVENRVMYSHRHFHFFTIIISVSLSLSFFVELELMRRDPPYDQFLRFIQFQFFVFISLIKIYNKQHSIVVCNVWRSGERLQK